MDEKVSWKYWEREKNSIEDFIFNAGIDVNDRASIRVKVRALGVGMRSKIGSGLGLSQSNNTK